MCIRDRPVAEPVAEPEPPPAAPTTDEPTQAGIPIFDDRDDVGWVATRSETSAPPELADEAAKPLFAPDPAEGEPVRRPRPGTPAAQAPVDPPRETNAPATNNMGTDTGTGVWRSAGAWETGDPWDTGNPWDTGADEVPGRRWIRLAMLLGLAALVLVAAVIAYQLGVGDPDDAADSDLSLIHI